VVESWVQGIARGEALSSLSAEGIYSQLLMDLTHESDATGWVHVPDLNAFLAVSS